MRLERRWQSWSGLEWSCHISSWSLWRLRWWSLGLWYVTLGGCLEPATLQLEYWTCEWRAHSQLWSCSTSVDELSSVVWPSAVHTRVWTWSCRLASELERWQRCLEWLNLSWACIASEQQLYLPVVCIGVRLWLRLCWLHAAQSDTAPR